MTQQWSQPPGAGRGWPGGLRQRNQWQAGSPWNQPAFGRAPQGRGFGGPQLGQPYYAPQPYGAPGPYGAPPPRRRRRGGLGLVLLALVGVILVGIVGLGSAGAANPAPSASYQNEDYQVPPPDKTPPPLPVPQTYDEAEAYVASNPFYRQTVPAPVRCTAQPINVATADDDQLDSHFESLMECLLPVWQPPVTGARFQIVRPTVTIYGKDITTKCGKSEVNAFYCSADQQVYFSNRLPDYVRIVKQNKWAADVVMAHEFGHALQARTGILVSAHALGQNAGSQSAELEMSRRLETQADCFAGMFTRSVAESLGIKQSDVQGIEATFAAVGDDTISGNPNVVGNHGLARSRQYWGDTGIGNSAVTKCNTFVASRSQVR